MELGLIHFIAEIKFLLDSYLHPTLFHTNSKRNQNTDAVIWRDDHFPKGLFSGYLSRMAFININLKTDARGNISLKYGALMSDAH